MQFGMLGINYEKADLDIRDKTAFTDQGKMEFLKRADQKGIGQCMVVSTCNRSEVYFFYEEPSDFKTMEQLYQDTFEEVDVHWYLICKEKEAAISYLFRVTAGLESMILGEDQILGQIKDALDFSRTMGCSGKQLEKVVRDAVTCAKKLKTDFKISEKPLSVSYIGIQKVRKSWGIKGKQILVIGSGKTSILTLRYLKEYKAGQIWLCSRTLSHAQSVKEEFPQISIIDYEDRYETMKQCDIVISATASPHLVIRKENFVPKRPIMFLDLAAPRDIDTGFIENPKITLLNLDTLQSISEENQRKRQQLVAEAETLMKQEYEKTMEWLAASRMDSAIQSLQERCQLIVDDSYRYLSKKLDLEQREKKILKKVLNASLQRLLKEPIQELKHLDTKEEQEAYKEMVQKLFQI